MEIICPDTQKASTKGNNRLLYRAAQSHILKVISENNLTEGDRLPSIRTLSISTGIARATLAKAIARMVDDGILDSKIGQGVYVANGANNVSCKLKTIYACIAAPDGIGENIDEYIVHKPFWNEVFAGIRRCVKVHDKGIKLRFSFLNDFIREKESTPRHRNWQEVGFILLGDTTPEILQQLLRLNTTIVCIHGIVRSKSVASIYVDTNDAAQKIAEHLVELGHRCIAYCGTLRLRDRINYYKHRGLIQVVQKYKIPFDEEHYLLDCGYDMNAGYETMKKVLALSPRPTAVMTVNDEVAIGAIRAAIDAGLKVPDDISVVGFDNTPIGRFFSPSLTTIDSKMRNLGEIGVSQLMAIHADNRECGTIVLKSDLIIRESTGLVPRR